MAAQNYEKSLPCPDKPNCINSEYAHDTEHYLPPLSYPAAAEKQIIPLAKSIIQAMGGQIQTENSHFLSATFTSRVFRFVDDVELRQDSSSQQLHIRSASRTGYSDFGVNKKRVNTFTQHFKEQLVQTIKQQEHRQ